MYVPAFRPDSRNAPSEMGPHWLTRSLSVSSSSPAIGAARGALEIYLEQTRQRVGSHDLRKVSEDVFAQGRVSAAASEIDAARQRLEEIFESMVGLARSGEPIPLELRARCRFDSAKAVERSIRATDLVFEASGGRAIYTSNPIQRFFRDVHAMRAHAMNNPDRAALVFGRTELGLPPGDPFV